MSRILKSRGLRLLAAGLILIVVLLCMKLWIVSSLAAVVECYVLLILLLDRETRKPQSDLNSNRKVRTIDTLIIGDWCSKRQLAQHFDLTSSLVVIAPGRSEKASLLLLEHLASRLDGKNVCIVLPKNDCNDINVYDVPYLSELTKLEIGLTTSRKDRWLYLLLHPSEMVKVLISPFRRLRNCTPNNEALVNYCDRKGFRLTCLK